MNYHPYSVTKCKPRPLVIIATSRRNKTRVSQNTKAKIGLLVLCIVSFSSKRLIAAEILDNLSFVTIIECSNLFYFNNCNTIIQLTSTANDLITDLIFD